jgi:peptide subunit release factor RF-3
MAVELERGVSVSSAVMSFEHEGLAFNLLDTLGDHDFSEGTSRFRLSLVNHVVAIIARYYLPYRRSRSGGQFALEAVGDP